MHKDGPLASLPRTTVCMRTIAKPSQPGKPHPSIVTIITEFNGPTPSALFWFNCSQMPPACARTGVVLVGHYFDGCIIVGINIWIIKDSKRVLILQTNPLPDRNQKATDCTMVEDVTQ